MKILYHKKSSSLKNRDTKGELPTYIRKRKNFRFIQECSNECSEPSNRNKVNNIFSHITTSKVNYSHSIKRENSSEKIKITEDQIKETLSVNKPNTKVNIKNLLLNDEINQESIEINNNKCFELSTPEEIIKTKFTNFNTHDDLNANSTKSKGSLNVLLHINSPRNSNTINNNNSNIQKGNISDCGRSKPLYQDNSQLTNISSKKFLNMIFKCNICERIYPDKLINKTKGCDHFFCNRCLKIFYTKQFYSNQLDINNIKCPIVSCNSSYTFNEVLSFLPSSLSKIISIQAPITGNYCLNSIAKLRENNNISNNSNSYSERNVIDVDSNEKFYLFSKKKNENCPFCNRGYLFVHKRMDYTICLNCLKKYCKFCMNEYNDRHFDKGYNYRCKIFFKIDEDEYIEKKKERDAYTISNCVVKFLFAALFVISGYLILFFGGINYIRIFSHFIFCDCNSKAHYHQIKVIYIIKILLIYFVSLILFCLLFPFVLLIIPYFPLIALF